jgi:hypothetical protein
MKNVLLGALVFLTAGCGAYQFPGTSPAPKGTVTGLVTVMPCGPVQPVPPASAQDSAPCRMRPTAGIEMDFASEGSVTSTLTRADGTYRIDLPEGTYKVSAKGYVRIVSGPSMVIVKAGHTLTADYLLDSGIRALPVPQQ